MNLRIFISVMIACALISERVYALLPGRISSLTWDPAICEVYFMGFLNDSYQTHDKDNCNCNYARVHHDFNYCTDVKARHILKGHELPPKENERERR
jgi:hypothetical protein